MKCGTPVITSNAGALPEVVGEAAIQFGSPDGNERPYVGLELWRSAPARRHRYGGRGANLKKAYLRDTGRYAG